jgi:hypothetical protein
MKVEFHRPDEPDDVVATAGWVDDAPVVESEDEAIRDALTKVFRRTPAVVVDDASYRRLGTHGEVVIQPGGLEWFRAVIQTRVPAETGLIGRMVPGIREGGFDPAAGYRSFEDQMDRLTSSS